MISSGDKCDQINMLFDINARKSGIECPNFLLQHVLAIVLSQCSKAEQLCKAIMSMLNLSADSVLFLRSFFVTNQCELNGCYSISVQQMQYPQQNQQHTAASRLLESLENRLLSRIKRWIPLSSQLIRKNCQVYCTGLSEVNREEESTRSVLQ